MAPPAAPKKLPYRVPKPILFAIALVGMGAVTGVALDAAGRGDVIPTWLLNGFIRAYVAPLSETLFGASWKNTVQVIAVLAWIIHLVETVYMWGYITGCSRASQGRWTVSTGVLVRYLIGTFLGGVSQITTCKSAIQRILNDEQPKRS